MARRLTQAVSTDRVLAQFCHSSVAVSPTGNISEERHIAPQNTFYSPRFQLFGPGARRRSPAVAVPQAGHLQTETSTGRRDSNGPAEAGELSTEPGLSSRPFVLCGLPMKRPQPGCLLHERRNGRFVLQVTGHPSYGLPWGQDRLVPIFLATMAVRQQSARFTFSSAGEMLDTFGIQQGGSQYRRLVASFQRIFGATIFFGTDIQSDRAAVVHRGGSTSTPTRRGCG